MTSIRRSIAWATIGQYGSLAVSFAAMLVMARMLTPAEFGIVALGTAILGIAEAVRELAGGGFIITERELTAEKIRTTTTINLLVTLAVVALLLALAPPLAAFFDAPDLAPYLSVATLGYALGPVVYPQQALLGRDMSFDKLAIVSVLFSIAGAAVSIALARLGFSSLSLAWGAVAASSVATVTCFAIRRDASIFRPALSQWRAVVRFGAYSCTSAILGRVGEALPMLIFGKLLDPARTALMHRAATLCLFPDKLILAVAGQVALPELSRQARQGTDLKATYLKALVLVSGVQWPFMALLAILAPQIVALLLGSQWTETVPLVRIIAPAIMFSLPISLQYSALVASGGVHLLPRLLAAQLTVTALALSATAPYGLEAAAWSMLVAVPLNALLSLAAVRSRIAYRWTELMTALAPSMFAALASAAGPLALALYSPSPMPWTFAAAAVGLGGAGWMLGLLAGRHALVRLLAPKLGFSNR